MGFFKFGRVYPFPGFCYLQILHVPVKAPSVARNETGQTGVQDCLGHTPEQVCLGESQLLWMKPHHKVVQLAIRSPVPELMVRLLLSRSMRILKIT